MKTETATRIVGWTLLLSAATGAVGVVFLIAMYAMFATGQRPQGLTVGRINDILALVSYLLATPAILALHGRSWQRPGASAVALTTLGLVGAGGIVALQGLLVADRLTFEQQIGPVTVAFLVLGAWFVLTDARNRATGPWPNGVVMSLFATLYLGYPVWAYRVARLLLAGPAVEPGPAVARHAET